MAIQSVNPANDQVVRVYQEATALQVSETLLKAQKAFETWRNLSFSERGKGLRRIAGLLREKAEFYSRLIAEEMGKPISQGMKEIEKCAFVCEYYSDNAEKFLAPDPVATEASKSYVAYEPLGIVLAVMPWNFPFWQVFRAAAPILMAGNVVLLKHASNVPGCAEEIAGLFQKSGAPDGILTNLFIETSGVAGLIEHPLVKAVTLTGSVPAGRSVASHAGKHLKKTVLELGGSDPYLVLEDADLSLAVRCCGESRLINAGQSCVAAKRFLVVESVYDEFVGKLTDYMKAQKMGDPFEKDTVVGPLARRDLREGIHKQVEASVKKGAEVLCGGFIPEGAGAFYPPTILGNVKKGMPVFDEEVFGPVAAVVKVRNEEEAIQAANDSVFGLGAAVFTRNIQRGENIARNRLKAGCAFVNSAVKSDPRLPFGGVDQSGYGRELGIFGIREFVNVKTVYLQ